MDGEVQRSIGAAERTAGRRCSEYSSDYYDAIDPHGAGAYCRENPNWMASYRRMADEIVRRLKPRTTLDVGCAKGFLVECLRDRGVEAYGFDVSEYAIGEVRSDVKPYCWVASASDAIRDNYDLITCIEVCEHLPESDAYESMRQMTSHTDTILFSSTPGDFSEPTHVNVRPIIDWLRLFAEFSFAPDQDFDAGFVAPQAMLLRRVQIRASDRNLCRFADSKNRAEISALRKELKEKSAALDAILNSRGWKLLSRYRDLRFRVKHPVAQAIRRLKNAVDPHTSYEYWIKRVEQRSYDSSWFEQAISDFRYKPKISIVTPVYNTPAGLLDLAIGSVQGQLYQNWELCICDDASSDPGVKKCLENWQERDPRIRVTVSDRNEGIIGASNRALQLAYGEFVGLLDHDDELSPNALYEVVKLLQDRPDADMIYSDEDKLDAGGRRVEPFFKPDWSPEYMLACMYTCHFGVYRKRLLDELGGFRPGFDGSQDYDLVLRLSEKTDRIYHIPKILYHWRMAPGSAAVSGAAKPYAYVAARRALTDHLMRRQIPAEIMFAKLPGFYRIRFNIEATERVSIIVPAAAKSDALRRCIQSIETRTSYPNYEIIVFDREKSDRENEQDVASQHSKFVHFEGPFRPSLLINFAATRATGCHLLLLHQHTEVISEDWIDSMLGFCREQEIGIVGAKLLYRDSRIQHAGLVLGLRGVAGHPLRKSPQNTWQGNNISCSIRNLSAVSAACLMVRKNVFEKVGGFDEGLSATYADIDFCLKVREAGYRIVWTPWAELYHEESACSDRRRDSQQEAYLRERWGKILENDPYYNPNLTLRHEDLGYRVE